MFTKNYQDHLFGPDWKLQEGSGLRHTAHEESTTTKLRVVFDASCKTSSGQSLNDLLMVGPKIQQELMEILIRFQQHNYVLIANISKMFRQIKINKRDRALQRVLWCLKQLALDNSQTYPGAAATIQNDFYMDDLITGSDSVSHLRQLKQDVVKILATARQELRKWNSNVLELLSNSENERPLASKEEVKTLGIHWNAQEDMFKFKVTIPREACKSKRGILSVIAQIYDPLGLIGPVIVKAKLFMRSLWKLSVNWDDKLPSEFMLEWNSYKERLEVMEEIQVPRQVVIKNAIKVEMHGFSPMKIISIPRLELCSAVLLANLTNKIRSVMTFPISKYVYWSDSSIVIHWIRGPVIVKAKLFMRSLWKLSVNWDDKLPSEFMLKWNSYKERLEVIEEISAHEDYLNPKIGMMQCSTTGETH
ncbi:PREDICTED: uncharacterized protein LOC108767570 [Trachymyrmex cornetzi]|uniref:uncharacterized protein LOC108767570 n=1 Tax=Trachymyrmex cornetzi TaxID=471704 RepID=UPI00084F6A90|nr:PREDICTED: uncharacterized protein LOC108767570 [Trachymyrmex cornetzi]